MSKKHYLLGLYIIITIVIILILLLNTDHLRSMLKSVGILSLEKSKCAFYDNMLIFLSRMDNTIPQGSVLFIGDSLIQGLCVQAISDKAINMGIGTDTASGISDRIGSYKSVKEAKTIFLSVGLNDLSILSNADALKQYKIMVSRIPDKIPIIISAVIPVDERIRKKSMNNRIKQFNSSLLDYCASLKKCKFIDPSLSMIDDTGNLSPNYHIGDGIHLNSLGNSIWISHIKSVFNKKEKQLQ